MEDQQMSFRTQIAKVLRLRPLEYCCNLFLIFALAIFIDLAPNWLEGGYSNDIPTTLHRSKADCPVPEEMVTVSVDGSVLDRIAKIMSYLRLGSSGKVLKKKKKERDAKVKFAAAGIEYDEEDKPSKPNGGMLKNQTESEFVPPPPPPLRKNHLDSREKQGPTVARAEEDIFVGEGVDYAIPGKDLSQSPLSEDMEESPRNKSKTSYFAEPAYGPVQPSGLPQEWQGMCGRIGHVERDCGDRVGLGSHCHGEVKQYEPWLRAAEPLYRRRVMSGARGNQPVSLAAKRGAGRTANNLKFGRNRSADLSASSSGYSNSAMQVDSGARNPVESQPQKDAGTKIVEGVDEHGCVREASREVAYEEEIQIDRQQSLDKDEGVVGPLQTNGDVVGSNQDARPAGNFSQPKIPATKATVQRGRDQQSNVAGVKESSSVPPTKFTLHDVENLFSKIEDVGESVRVTHVSFEGGSTARGLPRVEKVGEMQGKKRWKRLAREKGNSSSPICLEGPKRDGDSRGVLQPSSEKSIPS
ncbi:suppressor of mec-8 and unc-52 protein homolog 2-like [Fagus crenata]